MTKKTLLFSLTLYLFFNPVYSQKTDTIKIENVNVIPMNKEIVLESQTVLIANGKIVTIGPQDAFRNTPSQLIIDGTSKYLIPGLSEMHYHWRNNDFAITNELDIMVANGITTVRNMAEYSGQDHVNVRNKINSGEILGPNYYTTGPYLQAGNLASDSAIVEIVAQHKQKGYDFLKIGDGDNITKENYLSLLEEANRQKIDVIGHAQHNLPLEYSLRIKSIEHVEEFIYIFNETDDFSHLIYDPEFLNEAAEQIKNSGVYVAPTLVIFEMILQYLDEERFEKLKAMPEVKYLPKKDQNVWLSDKNQYRSDFLENGIGEKDALELFTKFYEWMAMFTKVLSDHGVYLLSGSDTFGAVLPGFSLHNEFELLQQAGLSPYEILLSSTINPARYLNIMAQEGTISEGKNANLILLDKNPLEDITNTRTIRGVMLKGVWLDRDKLDEMLKNADLADL